MPQYRAFKLAAVATSSVALAACIGPLVDVIRMDRLPASERAAALRVTVFPLGTTIPPDAQVIGPVQAHSCKNLLTDPPATQGDALQQLQVRVVRLGGNGVGNVTFDTRGTDTLGTNCWQTVTASGIALRLPGSGAAPPSR